MNLEQRATCQVCGEPMPPGEEMFNYHGYSEPCPKPHLPQPDQERKLILAKYIAELLPITGNRLGDIVVAMIDDLKSIDALVPRE